MLSRAQAQKLAEAELARLPSDCEVAVLEAETLTFELGWVFFYQSTEYLQTRNPCSRLAGNAPLIVNGQTGEISFAGTANPLQQYIAQYVARNGGI